VDPITYPKSPIVFLLSQWQQKSFLAAISYLYCENAVFLTYFAAIEIAGKLLGI